MNAISMAMPAQSRLKKSSEEISLAAYGERNAQMMLTAELSEIKPNTDASFQCVRGAERSPPLSVILNGRPNGLTRGRPRLGRPLSTVSFSLGEVDSAAFHIKPVAELRRSRAAPPTGRPGRRGPLREASQLIGTRDRGCIAY